MTATKIRVLVNKVLTYCSQSYGQMWHQDNSITKVESHNKLEVFASRRLWKHLSSRNHCQGFGPLPIVIFLCFREKSISGIAHTVDDNDCRPLLPSGTFFGYSLKAALMVTAGEYHAGTNNAEAFDNNVTSSPEHQPVTKFRRCECLESDLTRLVIVDPVQHIPSRHCAIYLLKTKASFQQTSPTRSTCMTESEPTWKLYSGLKCRTAA